MESGLQKPAGISRSSGNCAPVAFADMEQLRESREVGFACAEQALLYEEGGRFGEALHMYYNAMRHINVGLAIRLPSMHTMPPAVWEEARKIQSELHNIKMKVEDRIQYLAGNDAQKQKTPSEPQSVQQPTAPPIEGDVTGLNHTANGARPLGAPGTSPTDHLTRQMSARQLVHIPGGVQIFHISASGDVTVRDDPTELFIFTLNPAYHPISQQTVSWLQVGDFTYPLVPGRSPVLKTGYGAYMFPDVTIEGDQASSVALVLSADVSNDLQAVLDQVLRDYGRLEEQPQILVAPEQASFGQKVSDGIVATSELISRGLIRGAQATSVALSYGADRLRQRLTPEQRALAVDPRVQTGLKVARATTHVTCKVTGFVVAAVGDMTCALGRRIAKSLAPTEAVDGVAANGALNDAILIAGGGIAGFGTVFMGLEKAARLLASSITENTVTIVHHKYGENAGEVVGNAMYSVGNLALTANNVANLGVRGIAKRTAKETGKAVLQEYARTGQPNTGANYTVRFPDEDEDEVPDQNLMPGPSGAANSTKRG